MAQAGGADLLSVIPNIQKLLDSCVYLYTSMSDNSREKRMMRHVQEYRTYGGKISVNGNSYYVKVVVRLQKMGFSYYTMWTFQTKK
ncbi:hypothetical protein [Phascolarctobacterium succinatutens]|uniref:LPD3 domain-containing protein n=1 Tax=Phascolarctobacterium succinatutens TaxID=626940 RepID=UPI00350E4B56